MSEVFQEGTVMAAPGEKTAAASRISRQVGQRRQVTIVFCDIKGSTALAEQVDPEEWAEIVQGAFGAIIPAIRRYEGTVARLMGDGVLAFFGAPVAHEDDPYRAIRASLDILRDYRPFYEQVAADLRRKGVVMDETDLDVRIGIHTGLVVLGEVGAEGSVEYTAMGDAANTARRMQETAQPGTIQISQETYREVASYIQTEALGGIHVKGKQDPVQAYRVTGLQSRPVWVRAIEGELSPLVGRERELRQLNLALASLAGGEGQIISIIGEAGLGKTRLAQEVMESCYNRRAGTDPAVHKKPPEVTGQGLDRIMCYETASLSFETGQPYGMIKRLIRNACEVSSDDPFSVLDEHLQALTASLPIPDKPVIDRAFRLLFSLGRENGSTGVPGEEIRREILNGVSAFWQIKSSLSPTILIIEDLHWADAASTELLVNLLEICEDSPLLFFLIFRPDPNSPGWRIKQRVEQVFPHRYSEIWMEALLPWESDQLAARILGTDTLSEDIRHFIQDLTEGNPFFIEELVMELVERGLVVQETPTSPWRLVPGRGMIGVPDSLQSLILARVDRLEPEVQKTLQYASVIGRSFNAKVLDLIAGGSPDLEKHLSELQKASLIRRFNRPPEVEYSFHHTIVQEAIYNAILIRDRRRYHQRVGESMEEIFGDSLDQSAPLLAYHFDLAGDSARALRYFTSAGEAAMQVYANSEAIEHFTAAVESGSRVGVDVQTRVSLLRKRAMAFETSGDFDRALADYRQTLDIGRKAGERPILWQALLDLGTLWAARDYAQAEGYLSEALAISRELEDPDALAHSLNRMGNWLVNAERPRDGIQYHQEALDIFISIEDERGRANSLDLLGMAMMLSGDFKASAGYFQEAIESFRGFGDRLGLASSLTSLSIVVPSFESITGLPGVEYPTAIASAEEALQACREIGWRAGEAYALFAYATVLSSMGKFSQALKSAQDALDLANRIEHKQWMSASLLTLGLIYLEFEVLDLAKDLLTRGVALAREINSHLWINLGSGALALAFTLSGDLESARKTLDQVLHSLADTQAVGERTCWFSRAVLALSEGEPAYGLEILDHLIKTVPGSESGDAVPWLTFLQGELRRAMGDYAGAEADYLLAAKAAEKYGPISLEWRIHARLAGTYKRSGKPDLGAMVEETARAKIQEIVDEISEEELKRQFLATAERALSEDV